jgi:pimeloyl-ACP methyl ester carboxylesterase
MWMPLVLGAMVMAPALPAAVECPDGATCSSIRVPLDHTGAVPGTLPLTYARVPATGTRTGTIAILTGGPGQDAIAQTRGYSAVLKPARVHNDLLLVDQRGGGGSGAVDCDDSRAPAAPACADKLGALRPFLSTAETASDLEDLRATLGIERMALFGVSYGTRLATEYARRYPERTIAVVLDSAIYPGGPDLLNREWLRARPGRADAWGGADDARGILPGSRRHGVLVR